MKHIITLCFILLLSLTSSCEKEIVSETEKDTSETAQPNTIADERKHNALTVTEAQQADEGSDICVKGYIVAATTRSIKNADFESPFAGSSAIVLADDSISTDSEPSQENLFPICLTDCNKGIRNALNLEDNPQNWNHIIYIYGTRAKYMSCPGLKKVVQFEIIQ